MSHSSTFDIKLANELARLESYNKHLYRPNTYLHKWWARRCGTTFRSILKYFVEDNGKRGYYDAGGLEGSIVLDPMMGGGTTLHEAIRLGANVAGFDLDPIPVVQARASLSDTGLNDLEIAFGNIFDKLSDSLSPYFSSICPICSQSSQIRFMLYGQMRACQCDEVIMVDSLLLREQSDGESIQLCPTCHSVNHRGEPCEEGRDLDKPRIVTKGSKRCPRCEKPYREITDVPFYQRYIPLVKIINCSEHGVRFSSVESIDLESIERANSQRKMVEFDNSLEIRKGQKSSDLIRKGIVEYSDLFSSRQILYLRKAIDLVKELGNKERLFMGLLVSTSLEFNSMLCGYKGAKIRRAGAIRHAFSHHAYSFPYTALESNPVYAAKASGTLQKLFHDRIRRAREWSNQPRERVLRNNRRRFINIDGELDQGKEVFDPSELESGRGQYFVRQASAANIPLADSTVDYIVTDPPYYDSVHYADLSAFFRVWLRQMLDGGDAADIRWEYDQSTNAVPVKRSSGPVDEDYTGIMSQIFKECRRVLRSPHGKLAFTFHHWAPRAWLTLTVALRRAGFELLEIQVVHSENPISVHIANMRALTDDAILILAPSLTERQLMWELPAEIERGDSAQFSRECATVVRLDANNGSC